MKYFLRKSGGLLLSSLILLSVPAAYGEVFRSGDVFYKITSEEGRTVEITMNPHSSPEDPYLPGNPANGHVVISPTIVHDGREYTVTSVGLCAFRLCSGLRGIELPETIERIGERAFENAGLDSIRIPDSVTEIGKGAFYDMPNLKKAVLSRSLREIEKYSFSSSEALESVTIPEGIEKIGNNAFENTRGLKEVVFPSTLREIGEWAFHSSGLRALRLPDSLDSIGKGAFSTTYIFPLVEIPRNLGRLGVKAFGRFGNVTVHPDNPYFAAKDSILYDKAMRRLISCSALRTDGRLPEGVTEIARCALYYSSMPYVRIPDSVTSMDYAFSGNPYNDYSGCRSLISIELPDGADTILGLDECPNLTEIRIYRMTPPDRMVTSVEFNRYGYLRVPDDAVGSYREKFPRIANVVPTDYVLPQTDSLFRDGGICYRVLSAADRTAEIIPKPSFDERIYKNIYGNDAFGKVNIPERVTLDGVGYTVTSIADSAFFYCDMTDITLPCTITRIGRRSFYWTGIRHINIPESVTEIGDNAFEGTSLEEIVLPESVTSLGKEAFRYCNRLEKAVLPENLAEIKEGTFFYTASLENIRVPDGVRKIGKGAFMYSGIRSVELPDSGLEFGLWPFWGCKRLEKVRLPRDLEVIPSSAFEKTESLMELEIPASVREIGSSAFSESGIVRMTLPEGIDRIEKFVFSGCRNLVSVDIPESVRSIERWAFSDCVSLESVEFPEGLDCIRSKAFSGCSLSFYIPANVRVIEPEGLGYPRELTVDPESVFFIVSDSILYDKDMTKVIVCSSLRSGRIELPSSVVELGECSFRNCDVGEIYLSENMEKIGRYAFYQCNDLSSIYINKVIPPVFDYTWLGYDQKDPQTIIPTLYVPYESVQAYEKASSKIDLAKLEVKGMDFTGVGSVADPGCEVYVRDGGIVVEGLEPGDTVRVYDLKGQCLHAGHDGIISGLGRGFYIVRIGKTAKRVII